MKPVTFRNTKTDPRWSTEPFHEMWPRGYAYEEGGDFLYCCGQASGLWQFIMGNATLTEGNAKGIDFRRWLDQRFGADGIVEMQLEVGTTIRGVWRPGLYFNDELLSALGGSEVALRSAEQALRLLVERLDELLLYIEPSEHGLLSYSHKTRELLILACTEVEDQLKRYLSLADYEKTAGLTTNDYVKLAPELHLHEYQLVLRPYEAIAPIAPFCGWDGNRPTQSLPWYDAYNKTKHDRTEHFEDATLSHCLSAVAANVILFCVRWGPYFLLEGTGPLHSLVNQHFRIELSEPDVTSFYVPLVERPPGSGKDFCYFDRRKQVRAWNTIALRLDGSR